MNDVKISLENFPALTPILPTNLVAADVRRRKSNSEFGIRNSELVRASSRRLLRSRGKGIRDLLVAALMGALFPASSLGADATTVSYYHEIVPLLKRSCTGCHHPGKLKGELDLSSYGAFQKGGKHGAAFQAGKPDASRVLEEISGEEPNMPKEGDPLTKEEVALFARWIQEGAMDDTPPEANSFK